MTKLLLPVITDLGRLREALSLITITVTAHGQPGSIGEERIHEQCVDLLRRCIYPVKDVLLPAFAGPAETESFLIVASTGIDGAQALSKRICLHFERTPDLSTSARLEISAMPIEIPSGYVNESLEKQVQQVADIVKHHGRTAEPPLQSSQEAAQ